MDERKIIELVEAALQADALGALDSGRVTLGDQPPPRRLRKWRRFAATGLCTAAMIAIAVFVQLRTRMPALTEFVVVPRSVRSTNDEFTVTLSLSHPAYVSIIAIDERNERWLLPFGESAGAPFRKINEREVFRVASVPEPNDPRGPARSRYLIAVASKESFSDLESLLQLAPDPVMPQGTPGKQVEERLAQLIEQIERTFGCTARMALVPR